MVNYQSIQVERHNELLIIKQNRPESLNARNSQMYAEIIAALAEANTDNATAAVVLTGNGRMFCAGMDFNNDASLATRVLPDDSDGVRAIKAKVAVHGGRAFFELAREFVGSFIRFDKPLIAAVNGGAIGEGFSSVLHCDILYATHDAYFWAPFARAGAAPEFCATVLMAKRLGPTLANAALYLSRKITAEEAHRSGFVLELLDSENFLTEVLRRVHEGLALAGPPQLRTTTLWNFRRLAYAQSEKERLLQQADLEFDYLRERAAKGESNLARAYYSAQLPRKK